MDSLLESISYWPKIAVERQGKETFLLGFLIGKGFPVKKGDYFAYQVYGAQKEIYPSSRSGDKEEWRKDFRERALKTFGIAKRDAPDQNTGTCPIYWILKSPEIEGEESFEVKLVLPGEKVSAACKIEEYEEEIPPQPAKTVKKYRVICPDLSPVPSISEEELKDMEGYP